MPKTKRDLLKMKTAQALHHLDGALEDIKDLEETFRPQHPKYADYLIAICKPILISQEWLLDFWEKAWGKRPEDYNVWR